MIPISIEVSARHVHLSATHARSLFGRSLTVLRAISQKGQFAANEVVTLRGKPSRNLGKTRSRTMINEIRNVRVVGPTRDETQVELALSDCRFLGINNIPLKVSGNLKGTPGIVLVGPKGDVVIKRGVIVPARHIHCPPDQAKRLDLRHGQRVSVRIPGKRATIFENVVVRVRSDFVWRMHIDTDEANAVGIVSGVVGTVIV